MSLLALLLGCLTGLCTGLFPGLHINVVAAFTAALAPPLLSQGVAPFDLAIFILSAAVTHCYWELLPSLLLGVPSDPALALLPGHRLVREGRGLDALAASLSGSTVGVLGSALLLALLALAGPDSLEFLESLRGMPMAALLLVVSVVLIWVDAHRGWALAVFLASGLFGLVALNFPGLPSSESAFNALFPALTGLFGTSTLVLALRQNSENLPLQAVESRISLSVRRSAGWGILGGAGVGLLPGLGAGNMAALLDLFQTPGRVASEEAYLARVGAVNTSDALFGIAALYLLGRPRSGASVALESLMPQASSAQILGLAAVAVLAALLAHGALRRFGVGVARFTERHHGRALNLAVLVLLVVLVLGWTGFWGLVVLAAGTCLGMTAPLAGVRRTQAMGFLLVPTILFYSGLTAPVVTLLHLQAIQVPATPVAPLQVLGVAALGVLAAGVTYRLTPRAIL